MAGATATQGATAQPARPLGLFARHVGLYIVLSLGQVCGQGASMEDSKYVFDAPRYYNFADMAAAEAEDANPDAWFDTPAVNGEGARERTTLVGALDGLSMPLGCATKNAGAHTRNTPHHPCTLSQRCGARCRSCPTDPPTLQTCWTRTSRRSRLNRRWGAGRRMPVQQRQCSSAKRR